MINGAGYICKYSRFVYLGVYTRFPTHLIVVCSQGQKEETTNQTHACVCTFAWRHVSRVHLFICLFVYLFICLFFCLLVYLFICLSVYLLVCLVYYHIQSTKYVCKGGGREKEGGARSEGIEGCVCASHSVATCRICEGGTERERHPKRTGMTE